MGVKKYTQEVIKEGKRVRWPKREQFIPAVIAVTIICVFTALILSLEDWGAGSLINQLKQLFSGIGNNGSSSVAESVILGIGRLF